MAFILNFCSYSVAFLFDFDLLKRLARQHKSVPQENE